MPISSMIFLLFILPTIIYSENTFDCTGYEDDSYHPIYDADDCRHYWHCIYVNTVYMHAVKRICPAGTEFDPELRQCETSSLVNCVPARSPHMPRTTSTTKAWKWKYSRLFSKINWKPTVPYYVTTRKHPIFDLGDSPDIETTTTIIIPEIETTEQIQVLPMTQPQPTTSFSLEQLSKDLHALISNRHPYKQKSSGAKFFQPGEPENEVEAYTSPTKRRTRYSTETTTTQLPLTTQIFTTETTTTTTTTISSTTTTILTTTPDTSPLTSTLMTTESMTTININPQARMGGQRRRSNMTLYILTSDEHKIRQFSVNHTRGILINCNQLRRRLLGRRRLRDTPPISSTFQSLIMKNASIQIFQCNILLLTILLFFFFTKIIIIT